jgi:Rrf2 family protein
MIKLSTKGRYGTRLMLALAKAYTEGKKSVILKDVAEEEGISLRYLEQIIIPLKHANLVKSIRGAGGGYALARKPAEIKLIDILESLEGPCALVDCVIDRNFCNRLPAALSMKFGRRLPSFWKTIFLKSRSSISWISAKRKAGAKRKSEKSFIYS